MTTDKQYKKGCYLFFASIESHILRALHKKLKTWFLANHINHYRSYFLLLIITLQLNFFPQGNDLGFSKALARPTFWSFCLKQKNGLRLSNLTFVSRSRCGLWFAALTQQFGEEFEARVWRQEYQEIQQFLLLNWKNITVNTRAVFMT